MKKHIKIDELGTLSGRELIAIADKLKIRVACNKERTALKEKKSAIVERITAEVMKIKAQVEEAEKAAKAEAEKAEKAELATMTDEERKERRRQKDKERIEANKEKTKDLRESGLYEFNGKSQSLKDWSKELEIPITTLYGRIHYRNYSIEKAFTMKAKKRAQ